jgi:hypothetical protein
MPFPGAHAFTRRRALFLLSSSLDLSWWWLTPVDHTVIQGEAKFVRDTNGYENAYSARIPDVCSHRIFVAIVYEEGYGLR